MVRTIARAVTPRTRLQAAVVGAVLVGSLTAGVTYASIPDGSGVIYGCYKPSNRASVLKVIDTARKTKCPNGYDSVTWNQTGPQGPTGATGASGPTGATGPEGPSGPASISTSMASFSVDLGNTTGFSATALCNQGQVVTGGGFSTSPLPPGSVGGVGDVLTDAPYVDATGQGWQVSLAPTNLGQPPGPVVTVYALCAT